MQLRSESHSSQQLTWAENCFGQATKGTWGMSWRWKAKKGVEGCEKPGGAVKQALILGFPNNRFGGVNVGN